MQSNIAKLYLSMSIAAILAQPALTAPPEPLRLKPAGKWISDYQQDGCRLMRQFGEGDDKAIIVMSRFAPGEHFGLILAGNRFKKQDPDKVKLQFGTNEAEQEIDFLPGVFGELPSLHIAGKLRLAPMTEQEIAVQKKLKPTMRISLAPLGAAREKAVTFLQVGKPLKKSVVLELGAMEKPMAALSTCIHDLIQSWGVDAERHKNLTRDVAPKNQPRTWVTPSDYPRKMLNAGQPAIVNFRVLVDEKGSVTGCFIQQSTRPKEFDDAVCKSITKRAKFHPALDQNGAPLVSFFNETVVFRL